VEYLRTDVVPIGVLDPFPGNARLGDVPAIRESVRRFGQFRSILVREVEAGRLQIVAGNHTVLAMREEGLTEVRVEVGAYTDDGEASRVNAADNRLAELGGYDEALQLEQLESWDGDFVATGWSEVDLKSLRGPETRGEPDEGVPDAPDPGDTVAQPGDTWLLGDHRLLVGDAGDLAAVEAVMGGDLADCMWTDPPYGVEYESAAGVSIQGDTEAEVPGLLAAAFTSATAVLRPGAAVYVCHPAGPGAAAFLAAWKAAGWDYRQGLVWVKDSLVLGHSDFHYRHEPVAFGYRHDQLEYGFTGGAESKRGRGADGWFGGNTQTSVLEFPRPRRSEAHPTMKPVELIVRCLENSCPPGGLVLDLFAGSGSTLIAAHKLGARSVMVELDPRFADVICARFEAFTGIKPIRADKDAGVAVDA
jgi:site-specific DNA-methyltransferase (adenine-specific)